MGCLDRYAKTSEPKDIGLSFSTVQRTRSVRPVIRTSKGVSLGRNPVSKGKAWVSDTQWSFVGVREGLSTFCLHGLRGTRRVPVKLLGTSLRSEGGVTRKRF